MIVAPVLAIALAMVGSGCGRLGFTAASDTGQDAKAVTDAEAMDGRQLLGHDEDGDGLPDFADNCPHIANVMQANGDGDQAGDACDSFPTTQNTLQFYSLVADQDSDPVFEFTGDQGAWAFFDDFWIANSALNTNLHIKIPTGSSEIFIGYDVINTIGNAPSKELSVRAELSSTSAYYYGHYDVGGGANARVSNVFYDGVNYSVLMNASSTGQPFATGPASMSVRFDTNVKEIRTRFANSTGSYDVASPAPQLTTMPHYHLDARGAEIKIFYFAIVGS